MATFPPLNDRLGEGGANLLTAIREIESFDGSVKGINLILDGIADDLDAANTEGAFGVTLRVTTARLGPDYGWGGKGVLPSGSAENLRTILNDLADDIEDIRVAGLTFVRVHTKAKIPIDFLSGGKHLHRAGYADDGGVPSPGVGPDGLYDWILQALNAVATDIASIKSANSLAFEPQTVPIT
jgi:hypothetical protein